jgi:hypothetical protein
LKEGKGPERVAISINLVGKLKGRREVRWGNGRYRRYG